ncbi:AGAP011567-PA, partial [Anopheles gambiae str. PEST]
HFYNGISVFSSSNSEGRQTIVKFCKKVKYFAPNKNPPLRVSSARFLYRNGVVGANSSDSRQKECGCVCVFVRVVLWKVFVSQFVQCASVYRV